MVTRWTVMSVSYTHLDTLQRALHEFHKMIKKYIILFYLVENLKVMGFCEAFPKRTKMGVENRTIEQASSFIFLGRHISYTIYSISYLGEVDVWNKIIRFNSMNDTIKRTLRSKDRQEALFKLYTAKEMCIRDRAYRRLQYIRFYMNI